MASDLTKSQKAVQAAHAAAEWCQTVNDGWYNGTMVILEVDDLATWFAALKGRGNIPVTFREPDLGWRTTAIAVAVRQDERTMFSRLRLL